MEQHQFSLAKDLTLYLGSAYKAWETVKRDDFFLPMRHSNSCQ